MVKHVTIKSVKHFIFITDFLHPLNHYLNPKPKEPPADRYTSQPLKYLLLF